MQAAAYSSEPKITVGGGHFRRQHHGGPRSAFRREASEGTGAVEYEFVTIYIMSHDDKEPGKLLGRSKSSNSSETKLAQFGSEAP
jgi:hypothetical protein